MNIAKTESITKIFYDALQSKEKRLNKRGVSGINIAEKLYANIKSTKEYFFINTCIQEAIVQIKNILDETDVFIIQKKLFLIQDKTLSRITSCKIDALVDEIKVA